MPVYNSNCTMLDNLLIYSIPHHPVSIGFLVMLSTCMTRNGSRIGPILIMRFILDLRRTSSPISVTTSDLGTVLAQAALTDRTNSLVFKASTVDEIRTSVVSLSLPSPLQVDEAHMQWDELEASYEA